MPVCRWYGSTYGVLALTFLFFWPFSSGQTQLVELLLVVSLFCLFGCLDFLLYSFLGGLHFQLLLRSSFAIPFWPVRGPVSRNFRKADAVPECQSARQGESHVFKQPDRSCTSSSLAPLLGFGGFCDSFFSLWPSCLDWRLMLFLSSFAFPFMMLL